LAFLLRRHFLLRGYRQQGHTASIRTK
jgi:hypothetical protein